MIDLREQMQRMTLTVERQYGIEFKKQMARVYRLDAYSMGLPIVRGQLRGRD